MAPQHKQHLTPPPPSVQQEGKSGRTALLLAIELGNIEMLRFLAEACRADVGALTYGGLSGYQVALLNGRRDVAELLLQLGAGCSPMPTDSDMDTSSSDSDSEVSYYLRL